MTPIGRFISLGTFVGFGFITIGVIIAFNVQDRSFGMFCLALSCLPLVFHIIGTLFIWLMGAIRERIRAEKSMKKSLLGVAMVVVFCITWWLVASSLMEASNFTDFQSNLLGIGAGLLVDVLLLVGALAWLKLTAKA